MKKPLSACLALLLLPALLAAAEPASPRLPDSLILHARVASPMQFIKDMDDLVALSLRDTQLANRVPPGMLTVLFALGCPLPATAWDAEGEAHVLALVTPGGKGEFGFVVAGYGLDRVAEALQGNEQSREKDGSVLVVMLKKSGPRVCIREIGGGRLLITSNAAADEYFRDALDSWEPRLDSDAPLACRVDLANLQDIFKTQLTKGFADARAGLGRLAPELEKPLAAAADDDERETVEFFRKLGVNALAALPRLIDSLETELPSIQDIHFELDCRDERLLAALSLGAAEDSLTGELIAGYAGTANPDFPFIETVSDKTLFYTYSMPPPEKTAARQRRFFTEMINQIFAGTSTETAAELTSLVDGFADAAPRAFATEAHVTQSGDMLPITYSEWEHPEQVIPLIRRGAALLARLHGQGATLAEKHFRKMPAEGQYSGFINDFLDDGGFHKVLKPVFNSDDGERYGVPYADFAVDVNIGQLLDATQLINLPPVKRMMDQLSLLEENLKLFWALADGTLVFTNGALELDAMDSDLEEMLARLNGENDAGLAASVKEEWLQTVAADRQLGFSLCRPSRGAALFLLHCVVRFAPGDDALLEQAWEIFHEIEDDDSLFFAWSGAGEGRLRGGAALPAEGIREIARNGYALRNKVVVLVSRLAALLKNRR